MIIWASPGGGLLLSGRAGPVVSGIGDVAELLLVVTDDGAVGLSVDVLSLVGHSTGEQGQYGDNENCY